MFKLREYIAQRVYGPASGILVILGLIYGALGTLAGYLALWGPGTPEWFKWLTGIYPFLLTAWIIYREIDLARRRRYAPAMTELRGCFREYQDLCCYLNQFDKKTVTSEQDLAMLNAYFSEKMKDILSSIARCFSLITGVPCRACIKIIPAEQLGSGTIPLDEIIVLTMARDKDSEEQNSSTDQDRFQAKSDKIVDNSDFQTLYSPSIPDEGYYMCNNIPEAFKHGKYRNSSIDYRRAAYAASKLYQEDSYMLPYRSGVTWPIRHKRGQSDPSTFIGFLSVDAPARSVFDRRWDPPLGMALASALFEPIFRYSEIARKPIGADPEQPTPELVSQ